MAQSLEQLGVPQEMQERVKMMWLLTALGGLWGWIIVSFIWKVDGQDDNEWFQYQLKQAMIAGVVAWVLYVIAGIGALVHFIYGLLGFLAINKGEDYDAPVIAGMAKK